MSRRTLYLPALIVAAGLMVCAAAVLAASKEAEATFPGKNGNIAYTRLDGTDFEIYTIPPTGGAPTSLTNNGADDSRPAYSPDGTKIAFISDRDGNKEIYVMDATDRNGDGNGDNPTRLTNNTATDQDPSYSPDGTKIAFETLRDSNKEIYVMDAADRDGDGNGDNPTRLTNNAAPDRYPDWGSHADVSPPTDTTPPTVTGTVPAPGALNVARGVNVTATFSEEMLVSEDPLVSSINAKTFKLFKQGSTNQIASQVSYDAAIDMATLNPNNNLSRGVTYKAVITTGAKDLAGNPLDQNNSPTDGLQQKAWTFTVKN